MRSDKPKVLHPLAMKPLLVHVLDSVRALAPERIMTVIGYGAGQIRALPDTGDVTWVTQEQQKGTGHAVACALSGLATLSSDPVLILNGDTPLIGSDVLRGVLQTHHDTGASVTVLTTRVDSPTGYGRVVRDAAGRVVRIVEERDADAAVRAITEINTGVYCVDRKRLAHWISRLSSDNAQGEYYLTDMVSMAAAERESVTGRGGVADWCHDDAEALLGINSRQQLSRMERILRDRLVDSWMEQGVTFTDPLSCWLATDVRIGPESVIEPGVTLGPGTVVGAGAHIGPYCWIAASHVGDQSTVLPFCHLEGCIIVGPASVGPYARLRPGTRLEPHARVGNFCELKKAHIGAGSKISHLSYIGDTRMGSGVNVGAGTITCNYDGVHKHETVIGDGVFIGSDSQLVAPVVVADQAFIAAGSTITRDVPSGMLALSRTPQRHVPRRRIGKEQGRADGTPQDGKGSE
jgi:bifunctional UDP-N-acetylglucosamine pyrophosphorylase/glucosamine-1-phosphate N-acetyltransferase